MVLGQTGLPFADRSMRTQFLEHIPLESLHGLSVQKVIDWEIGSVIVFDCGQLHCSSSLASDRPGRKEALTIMKALV